MKSEPKILVVGATGYLGRHIVQVLLDQQRTFTAVVRNSSKLIAMGVPESQIHQADVTASASLAGICQGVDVVISCLGITRQKDGLGYMDVDYQANLNVLQDAERSGVKKFIYVSALNAPLHQEVRLLHAKEQFAQRLLASETITPCVIRPNGFFSDLKEVYDMASRGTAYVFGSGEARLNPIHGSDLAQFCVEAIDASETELDVGGPDILSMTEIAQLAFEAQHKRPSIVHVPDWVRKIGLRFVGWLPEKWGGPAEFFLTVTARDMIAPQVGTHSLRAHYTELAREGQ
ncbi:MULTISPECIES: SDR family oxidoreductase [Vibrio]|uniref:SDR family oxidoreductase n=1 Tax=Vibrio TaxID=662 RepID=UPI0001B955F6|nr:MULTISPECIES: SDR family oxidoreductase [Vibrio]EEX34295.1 hypothetical protein VIC_001091 [Vibrio coralliilyticus ATCC BAA-450]MDE3898338.1 SDR family oxidoreductase [Vibrio sp. CC007]